MTKIIQIRCPKCNTPIFSKTVDSVFLCESCGTMHVRDSGTPEAVGFQAGKFVRQGDGERVYLPVWVTGVTFNIDDIKSEGGGLSNLFGLLSGQSKQGSIVIYIPAYEMEPMTFKDTAMRMTASPPKIEPDKLQPGVKRQPVVLTSDQLEHIAEFLFVTGVAEKPGVLQRLDYRLSVTSKTMLYLPYYTKGDNYQPGY
ncbi:MAG: hypothetical protein WBZ29_10370 [Methanocella sp.]